VRDTDLSLRRPFHHADGFLHRLADQGFDFSRRGAGVLGAHRQRGIAEVRQQVDLEAEQRDHAEQHEGERHHRHGDAATGGELDQAG
jgi:hypothetical protein